MWFVGREEELRAFAASLKAERPEYLLIAISGQGGVGKTTLLRRYRQLAEDYYVVTALSDSEIEPAGAMGQFVKQLASKRCRFQNFDKRYRIYERLGSRRAW
jgi:GTPase SAR1 family protein